MSELDVITPCVVYRWPDDWWVTVYIGTGEATIFSLRNTNYDDRWSVAHYDDGTVCEWSIGRKGWQEPDVPTGEARKKLIGFLLDLGVERPKRGSIRSSLVWSDTFRALPRLPYPRWVDDSRWERRHEEAKRFVWEASGHGISAGPEELYLGVISGFVIGLYHENWIAKCDCQTLDNPRYPTGRDLNNVIEEFLRREILLPESERPAWEAENVIRGSWVVPSPEEVELYQAIGERNPLLWGSDRLLPWLRERP